MRTSKNGSNKNIKESLDAISVILGRRVLWFNYSEGQKLCPKIGWKRIGISDCAYKWFMAGDFSVKGENANNVIDIDDNDCNTTKIEKQNVCLWKSVEKGSVL